MPDGITEPLRECYYSGVAMMIFHLIGIVLVFNEGSYFLKDEMAVREMLMSSLFLHFISGLLFAAGRALTAGLFHGYHNSAIFEWGVTNNSYYGLKWLACEEFLETRDIYLTQIVDPYVRPIVSVRDWSFYLDPTVRILITIIMIAVLFKFISIPWKIIQEIVPRSFNLKLFKLEIMQSTSCPVGHFHIWDLGDMLVGSLALHCHTVTQYLQEQDLVYTQYL